MKRHFTGVLVAMAGVQLLGGGGSWAEPLTSAAIDPGLFREGAIQRFTGSVGAWGFVCDEVKQLKQRFCSLRSAVKDRDGTVIADLTVSTGEDGRPAALLKMAADRITEDGISIIPRPAAGAKGSAAKMKGPVPYKVYPAACDRGVCQLIWSLTGEHIVALNTGAGLTLRYGMRDRAVSALAAGMKPGQAATRMVEETIDATGFAEALNASLQPTVGGAR